MRLFVFIICGQLEIVRAATQERAIDIVHHSYQNLKSRAGVANSFQCELSIDGPEGLVTDFVM